jgi:hypothetical protein
MKSVNPVVGRVLNVCWPCIGRCMDNREGGVIGMCIGRVLDDGLVNREG